jgi:hypothetical protein
MKTICKTQNDDKQSCKISLKSAKRFRRWSSDKLILLKNWPLRGHNFAKKILAENQDNMHNKAWWQTILWNFNEIPKVVKEMKPGQAYFTWKLTIKGPKLCPKKILAENQDNMHDSAWLQTILWSFTEIPPAVLEMMLWQADFTWKLTIKEP